jgi:hypothetical protein
MSIATVDRITRPDLVPAHLRHLVEVESYSHHMLRRHGYDSALRVLAIMPDGQRVERATVYPPAFGRIAAIVERAAAWRQEVAA